MKTGILTFSAADNYGAMLQCRCLYEVLRGLGHDVSVIDYRPEYLTAPYGLWKKGSLNTGYEIAYSTDADFFSAQTKVVKGSGTTRTTLKNLQAQTTYYVRIRTYRKVKGNVFYSAWSKAKSIKTK